MSSIKIESLSFTYRGEGRPALQEFTAEVGEGTFLAVMGHGGAGKSTLCCALNGLIPGFFRGDYRGRVWVKGQEVAGHPVARMSRTVGLLLQDFEAQLFSTNVELEMAFGPENHCLSHPEIERRITAYLEFVRLARLRKRSTAALSGGQKQRLAIGSVLALEPDVLVMDEPTTDLDPQGREEVLSVAQRLRREGRTLVMVDHEPETAAGADQVWLLREGRLAAQGPPSAILRDLPLLGECGVKAPPTVELFQALGWPGSPLTAEEAISLIRKEGLAIPRKVPSPAQPARGRGAVILQAEGLSHFYLPDSVRALDGIDLSIQEGEFIALLGQNGSGKTTLAKHCNGLLKPASGRMLVRGKPTGAYGHRELARLVGYVFQNPDHQIFARTVYDEVAFGLKVLGESSPAVKPRVAEALEAVGLRGYENRVPFILTKGERQRVAVASVLAAQPQVIILDEPTTGLDYRHQRDMMAMLQRLHRRGHTIIIITHSMWVAAEYAERTILMKDGRVLLDGPTRAVFADETRLAEAALRPSSLVKLSNWIGAQALTVEGMARELKP